MVSRMNSTMKRLLHLWFTSSIVILSQTSRIMWVVMSEFWPLLRVVTDILTNSVPFGIWWIEEHICKVRCYQKLFWITWSYFENSLRLSWMIWMIGRMTVVPVESIGGVWYFDIIIMRITWDMYTKDKIWKMFEKMSTTKNSGRW